MKNNRRIVLTVLAVVVIGLLMLFDGQFELSSDGAGNHEDTSVGVGSQEPASNISLVTQVRKCAKLYTAEYRVHKIVTHDDVLRLKGSVLQRQFNIKIPLGDRRIAIPIDAKLKAWIDFSQFSEKNIERHGDRITIILPDPQVTLTSSTIDQKNVRQHVALARANFSDAELANYLEQGRAAIIQSIPEMGIIETAQANAAKVLVPMLTEMGYDESQVTVAFRKQQYSLGDIQTLLKIDD